MITASAAAATDPGLSMLTAPSTGAPGTPCAIAAVTGNADGCDDDYRSDSSDYVAPASAAPIATAMLGEVVDDEQPVISDASSGTYDEQSCEQSGSEGYDNGAESYDEYSDANSESEHSQDS